jgi:hypothetical protein
MQISPLFKGDFPFREKAAAGDKVMHPRTALEWVPAGILFNVVRAGAQRLRVIS